MCVWCVWRVCRRVYRLLFRFLWFLILFPRSGSNFIVQKFRNKKNTRMFVTYEDDYDSTWDDEEVDTKYKETEKSPMLTSFSARGNAAKDMQTFRHKCNEALEKLKDLTDDDMENEDDLPNVQFYRNNKKFTPDGVFIEEFHSNWVLNYGRLEYSHTYIQWLFPILEKGMNFESYELSLTEMKCFHQDENIKRRLLKSYKIMLGFYGITLQREDDVKVKRAKNWEERSLNLNRNSHNNLRITRMLKCLGLLGLGHYQAPLVRFFLEETLVRGTLPRVKRSVLDYFMFAVLDKSQRRDLIRFAFRHFSPREQFVWCPKRIRDKLQKEIPNDKENDPVEGSLSSHSSSQSHRKDLMNSRVQNKDETKGKAFGKFHTNRSYCADSAKRSAFQRVDGNFDNSTAGDKTGENVANKTARSGNSDADGPEQLFDTRFKDKLQKCVGESFDSSGHGMKHEINTVKCDAENSADMERDKSSESDENSACNLPRGSEHRNRDAKQETSKKQAMKKKHSMKENPEDRFTDACVSDDVTSNNTENSGSTDVKGGRDTESELDTAHTSDRNLSPVLLVNDPVTEGAGKKSITEEQREIESVGESSSFLTTYV